MDPNTNLAAQERILLRSPIEHRAIYGAHWRKHERMAMRDLREELTNWIGAGGFEPDWSKCQNAARYYGK